MLLPRGPRAGPRRQLCVGEGTALPWDSSCPSAVTSGAFLQRRKFRSREAQGLWLPEFQGARSTARGLSAPHVRCEGAAYLAVSHTHTHTPLQSFSPSRIAGPRASQGQDSSPSATHEPPHPPAPDDPAADRSVRGFLLRAPRGGAGGGFVTTAWPREPTARSWEPAPSLSFVIGRLNVEVTPNRHPAPFPLAGSWNGGFLAFRPVETLLPVFLRGSPGPRAGSDSCQSCCFLLERQLPSRVAQRSRSASRTEKPMFPLAV